MGPKSKTNTLRQQQPDCRERKIRAEFSDADITDDEQTQGSSIELTAEEDRAFKYYLSKNNPSNTRGKDPSNTRSKDPSNTRDKDPSNTRDKDPSNTRDKDPSKSRGKEENVIEQGTTVTAASVIEATPTISSKSVPDKFPKICTPVFLLQLGICVLCVFIINYIHISYLLANIHDKIKQEEVIIKTMSEKAEKEINGLQSSLMLINQTLDTLLSGTVQWLNKIQSDTEVLLKEYQYKLDTNTLNKDVVIKIIMLLFTMLFVVALFVFRIYRRPYGSVDFSRDSSRRNLNNMNSNAILNHIPSSPALVSMLCIISFDEDRQRAHKKLLASANIADNVVKCHVIRRHEHIPELPRCQIYLMCPEFTEEHVIIEEQGKGLGDLHRTTYQAVHKLGGHLIILYTKDPGSRRLKDDQIYNHNIYCVTNQPELAVLNNKGCFFSTYDNLTEGQKTRLRDKIKQYIQ